MNYFNTMSKTLTLQIQPFEYTITLYEFKLVIRMIQNNTYKVWEKTIVNGYIESLDIDAIYDIFEQHNNNILDKNITIDFPNDNNVCININFAISYGKNKVNTKTIIMDPIIIPNEDILNKRFKDIIMLYDDKIEELDENLGNNMEIISNKSKVNFDVLSKQNLMLHDKNKIIEYNIDELTETITNEMKLLIQTKDANFEVVNKKNEMLSNDNKLINVKIDLLEKRVELCNKKLDMLENNDKSINDKFDVCNLKVDKCHEQIVILKDCVFGYKEKSEKCNNINFELLTKQNEMNEIKIKVLEESIIHLCEANIAFKSTLEQIIELLKK